MMSKYSALLLLPVFSVVLFVTYIGSIFLNKKAPKGLFYKFIGSIGIAFLVLWAGYAFEFKPFLGGALRLQEKMDYLIKFLGQLPFITENISDKIVHFFQKTPIPLSSYMLGVVGVLRHGAEGVRTYFFGTWIEGGHRLYYVLVLAIKTPVPIIVCFLAGLVIMAKREWKKTLHLYLIFITIIFVLVASKAKLQLGLRYILPVYPFIFIIAGEGLSALWKGKRLKKMLAVVFLTWIFVTQIFIWPDYLSYFNELIGGPSYGYKYLRGANIDWGQDLPAVKEYMSDNDVEIIRLDYFGEGNPSYYGIDHRDILSTEINRPGPFVYGISLQRIDGYPWAFERKPDKTAGRSIFIYDFRVIE